MVAVFGTMGNKRAFCYHLSLMEASDALFDGLEMELRSIEDLYMRTPGFKDPAQIGGEKEWRNFEGILGGPELSSNKILRGIGTMFRAKVQSLVCDSFLDMKTDRRQELLKNRRMVLVDCIATVRSARSLVKRVLQSTDQTAYQEMRGADIVELSHTHIPELREMEHRLFEHPFDGSRFNLLYQQMKDEGRWNESYGLPRELHLRVAAHPSRTGKVHGYMFSKTVFNYEELPTYEYRSTWETHREKRRTTEVMSIGLESDMVDRLLPSLLGDLFKNAVESDSMRLEDKIAEYHRKA